MNKELFDLDINKKMETPTEMTAQTWTTVVKVSKAVCKTGTCICTTSCSNCK
ncbi:MULTISPECIES: type A lantibiotic [Bacillus cereus group]|uniref:Lantibiotic paenibacillin n=1 Tax=Bacillus cereus TaxID=1396 RepID=A0A9X7E0V3_BACCE|nr:MULTISPECIES: type A lantibiotic [Bacillus cereus group]EOO46408.1 lantibiotic paenibacillin [Bacillus cereus BAG1X2-2]EOO46409.1 lantibiotic paenibacillin [Bacillus cereus BAG1X2-2]EOP01404.1 lantibiotic paenibacillin [Bacillus cereus BAG2O-1]MCU7668075.1 type A lantibiotic [Bacillus thuringiensis]MCU7668076.1 type A lantibiotic [Bacillus thuringiensis]